MERGSMTMDFTNAPEGAGDATSLTRESAALNMHPPIDPAKAGGRATLRMRKGAAIAMPAPTHPGESGAAGHKVYAQKSQVSNASGNIPRKGRQGASERMRNGAEIRMPPAEDCSDVATPQPRESATSETPIGANQSVRGEAALAMRKSARLSLPALDGPKHIEGEAITLMRESAKRITPAFDVTELVGLTRTRRTWMQARNRLYLHALSICRSACDGDKKEAVKLYKATASGEDMRLHNLIGPFLDDIARWDARVAPLEKAIVAQIERSPIAGYIRDTKGLGPQSMATLIGMTGPLDQYATVPKIWRVCGLAVSADGTSRDPMIVPGETDRRPRRAAVYVLAAGVIKAGNEDMRAIYDREKEKALAKGWVKGRAHNHAMRVVGKFIVRRAWKVWRAAA